MALPSHSLITLAELKAYIPIQGPLKDSLLETLAGMASADLEAYLGRRLVFRAPTEDDDQVLASTAWANGNPAVSGQPASPGRTLVVAFPTTATAGVLTVTGTVAGAAGATESFDVAQGAPLRYGVKFFTSISAISIAGAAGTGNVKVGTSLGYVEYHSPDPAPWPIDVWPLEWPVQELLEVNEDATRVYGAATKLVGGVDFQLADRERLVRLWGGYAYGVGMPWAVAYRAVKLVYSAGYAGAGRVPGALRRLALRLATSYYQESQHGQIELASGSNALGSWTRSGPAAITKDMQHQLARFSNRRVGAGERDFDLEAA